MGRTSDAKSRLIESAMSLMADRGYTAVGVNDICNHAGVKKGSFYHFFESKEHLAREAIAGFGASSDKGCRNVFGCSATSALDKIRGFVNGFKAHQEELCKDGPVKGCPLGNLALELSTQSEALREEVKHAFERWVAHLTEVVAVAMATGELPPGDAKARAQSVVAYLEGTLVLAKAHNDASLLKDVESNVLRLLGHNTHAS